MKQNYISNSNYLKISRDSGCVSGFYNTNEEDEKITLMTSDSPEISGAFLVTANKILTKTNKA